MDFLVEDVSPAGAAGGLVVAVAGAAGAAGAAGKLVLSSLVILVTELKRTTEYERKISS